MSNTLKVRDDQAPICFEASAEDVGKFKLCEGAEASWLSQGQAFGIKELRSRVEPWLTALFQSEHLSLLAGSGLTHAVHYLAAGKPAAGMNEVA
ncbi:fibronectin-binding protein (FBP), partial [Achromobacter dolens]